MTIYSKVKTKPRTSGNKVISCQTIHSSTYINLSSESGSVYNKCKVNGRKDDCKRNTGIF